MLRKGPVFALFILILTITCAKKEDKTLTKPLASIGNGKITFDEFQTRYEFSPRIHHYADPEDGKKTFLASLIAEKLFAEVGRNMKLDTASQIALMTKQMQKEAVIEALFEKEVADKIQISEEEIKDAYLKSKQTLMLKYIVINNKNEALRAFELIENGLPFNSVASKYLSLDEKIPTKKLTWGEALQSIEDAVFELKRGQITEPIDVDNQFYIFQLENKTVNIFNTEFDYYQSRPSLKKQIRRRKRGRMFSELIFKILNGTRVKVPAKVFNLIATDLEEALEIGGAKYQKPKFKFNHLMLHSDYMRATSQLADNLDQPFARFSDGSIWTIREFLQKLWLGPYPLNYKSKKSFRASLKRTIPFMVELERLAQQGYRQGYHKTASVREQTRFWQDSFIANAVQRMMVDTLDISDEACQVYYEKHKQKYCAPAMLKIQEILVESKELAERLLEQIKSGADMAILATKYSKRELSAHRGGISGYFTSGSWGTVGEAAAKARPGELVGPIQTENNRYSIFKVIENKPSTPIPFEKVSRDVKYDALQELREATLERYLQSSINDYPVSIDTDMLDTLKTIHTGSGMIVFKQHFPGRMITPFVQPTNRLETWQAAIYRIYDKSPK